MEQFLKLYYSGRGAWNEETETLLFPSNGTAPAQNLKESAYKVKEIFELAKQSVFEMPELEQFKPERCSAHAVKCCWPRDRQAGDNNGNCNSPYDSNCVDKDAGKCSVGEEKGLEGGSCRRDHDLWIFCSHSQYIFLLTL